MAPRANWKGYLKLSLVSCAVSLFPATSRTERIRFNILNRHTGNRVRYDVVDSETGEPVEQEDRVKGYKVDADQYVLVEEEDFDKVALESTHTIEIESFVPRDQVDDIYLDEAFYLAPDDKVGVDAFAVIREAMQRKKMVGLARVVLYKRERLLMLEPRGKGIMASGIRFANEVRGEEEYFADIPDVKLPKDMIELAEHILDTKATKFDPSKFEDRYETALADLIAAKQAGRKPQKAAPPQASNVINLMDALRKSVQSEKGGRAAPRGRSSAPAGDRKQARAKRAPNGRKKLKRAS